MEWDGHLLCAPEVVFGVKLQLELGSGSLVKKTEGVFGPFCSCRQFVFAHGGTLTPSEVFLTLPHLILIVKNYRWQHKLARRQELITGIILGHNC